jgi:hypothetical protein
MLKALISNSLVFAVLAGAALLYRFDVSVFRAIAQEDRFLEWATFWAFVVASVAYAAGAVSDRRTRGGIPWAAAGLAAFCLLVALEEISWGQRLFGYRPPAYFLEQNYQQEFNLHNVIETDLRMLAMLLILVGYGVLASALALSAAARGWLERLRVVVPPPTLIPSFGALALAYAWYPVDYTGEWVECGLGLAFLAAAACTLGSGAGTLLGAAAATAALAAATVAGLGALASDPDKLAAARAEIEALVRDFESPKVHTRCGIHKRLYTFMREYGQPGLVQGEFARLVMASDGSSRAGYLLDPWNSPYWVRHECDGGIPVRFVYSFGPNRQRDSTERELLGDDIGAYFSGRR